METLDRTWSQTAEIAETRDRSAFLRRVYTTLSLAVLAFTCLEIFYFKSGLALPVAQALLSVNWLLVLGAFVLVAWLARSVVAHSSDTGGQWLGLAIYIAAESLLFVPLLVIAEINAPGAIRSAAVITILGFGALTGIGLTTSRDYSFLRGILMWGGAVALLAIVGSVLFGKELGTWFSVAMIALAGASVLYDTQKILRHVPDDRAVGAALELFAGIALMLWYVLRLFAGRRR